MRKIRTIIVEDEPLPRQFLRQRLERLADRVLIVGEYAFYAEALRNIVWQKPDLLLLDIQLGDRDCMQLLDELQSKMPLPYIIFTTAYDSRQYLMRAIKLQAVDYLLKPVSQGELEKAIDKVARQLSLNQRVTENDGQRLTLHTTKGLIVMELDAIAYVKAARNYSVVSDFHEEIVLTTSLLRLEEQLPDDQFVRVDRSTLVNVSLVRRIDKDKAECLLRSPDGQDTTLRLSKVAIETLTNILVRRK